ncbi:MAG: glycosyltransferase [Sphingobacteriales bacterium]|nr:glycosyltransferase [Sphingobacteriales bacterium]
MKESSLISICIPCLNSIEYIKDTIESLLNQSYKNIELIVIDESSSDGTWAYLQSIIDPRVVIYRQIQKGASVARNAAYKHSTGSEIIFFDADDLIDSHYIETQSKLLNGRTDSVVLAQWGRFYNNDLTTFVLVANPTHSMTLQTWVQEFWYHANPMTNPGRVLIPRPVIEKAGLWNEKLTLNDDLEFFTRIFFNSMSIVFNNKSTFYYRSGINGLSGKKGEKAYSSLYKSVKSSTEIVSKTYEDNLSKKACANMWQSLIYEFYPHEKKLIKLAELELKMLVASDLRYPAGGFTKMFVKVLGWRLSISLKHATQKLINYLK